MVVVERPRRFSHPRSRYRAQAKVVVALFDGTRHRPRRAGGSDADLPARPLLVPGLQSGGDVSGGDVVDVAGHAYLR
jgi:hypothetical protein